MKPGAPLRRNSELKRTKGLSRGSGLRTRPRKKLRPEARAFKNFWMGKLCACGCGRPAEVTHHVVLEQYLDEADKWDLDNAMALAKHCHNNHHSANGPRIRRVDLAEHHLNFAARVLGGRAGSYFARRYS